MTDPKWTPRFFAIRDVKNLLDCIRLHRVACENMLTDDNLNRLETPEIEAIVAELRRANTTLANLYNDNLLKRLP